MTEPADQEPVRQVDGVVVDLDGTVYHGDRVLPGASEAVDRIRASGTNVCFFSNNPIHDGPEYVDRLRSLGVDARPGEACSAAQVTCDYLADSHAGDALYFIGSDELEAHVGQTGVDVTDEPGAADVLLASWTDEFHYRDLVAALRAVDDGTAFFGTDPDRTYQDGDGRLQPGSGAIINAVAGVINRDPDHVFGKPSREAVEAALARLDCAAEECLVVGDRLDTDIAMGERAGMTTVLVRTGVTSERDLARSELTPDYVIDSLGDLPDLFAGPQ